MSEAVGLEGTFDTASDAYEKMRPGYVDELYRTIFDYIPINEKSNVATDILCERVHNTSWNILRLYCD